MQIYSLRRVFFVQPADRPNGAGGSSAEMTDVQTKERGLAPEPAKKGPNFLDPPEEILQLGLMRHDAGTIALMLNQLPKRADTYRGNLRVIIGAARAIERRAKALLGEGDGED